MAHDSKKMIRSTLLKHSSYITKNRTRFFTRAGTSRNRVQPPPTPQTDQVITTSERLPPPASEDVEAIYTNDGLECESWIRTWITDHVDNGLTVPVGFDVEWRPTFIPQSEGGKPNKISVFQLGVEKSCLVFHIYHAKSLPRSFREVLINEKVLKVGCGVTGDVVKLKKDYGHDMKGIVDLPTFASIKGCDEHGKGLKTMSEKLLGMEVIKPKSISMSNWEEFPLKSKQIQYAAMDAWLSFKIFQQLDSMETVIQTSGPKESLQEDFKGKGKGWRASCQFICPGCKKKCKTEQELEEHMTEKQHPQCQYCGKLFLSVVPKKHLRYCQLHHHLNK